MWPIPWVSSDFLYLPGKKVFFLMLYMSGLVHAMCEVQWPIPQVLLLPMIILTNLSLIVILDLTIKCIWIHVDGANNTDVRFAAAFEGVLQNLVV